MPRKGAAAEIEIDDGQERRLVEAAVRCLRRSGTLTVSDIAAEAQLSRATAYRAFSRLTQILERVIQLRLGQIGSAVHDFVEKRSTFEDAIISGILESVRHVMADQVFVRALAAAGYRGLAHLLVDSHDRVMPVFAQVWGSWLERARASGELSEELSDREVFEYVRAMQMILLTSKLEGVEARRFITRVVLPVIHSMRREKPGAPARPRVTDRSRTRMGKP